LDITCNFQQVSVETLIKRVLNSEHYPLLSELYSFFMVVPLTTVDCERVFSTMNLIKTDRRSRLLIDNLNSLMLISILGPETNDDDLILRSIDHWKRKGRRYFA